MLVVDHQQHGGTSALVLKASLDDSRTGRRMPRRLNPPHLPTAGPNPASPDRRLPLRSLACRCQTAMTGSSAAAAPAAAANSAALLVTAASAADAMDGSTPDSALRSCASA